MKRKRFLLLSALAASAMLSTAAFAQMLFLSGTPGIPPPPVGMMLAGLNLTSQQQSAVAAIMKAHQSTIAPLMDQLRSEHEQVTATLLSPGNVTLADFTSLQQETAQTEQQLQQEMLKAGLEIRALLTPDQLATAAQKQKKLDELHQQMHLIMAPAPGAP
jgi:Spy/CpxP family protein refolding chaperone